LKVCFVLQEPSECPAGALNSAHGLSFCSVLRHQFRGQISAPKFPQARCPPTVGGHAVWAKLRAGFRTQNRARMKSQIQIAWCVRVLQFRLFRCTSLSLLVRSGIGWVRVVRSGSRLGKVSFVGATGLVQLVRPREFLSVRLVGLGT
jgi:hypothetical protein